jgi:hypothetical protein
MDMPLKVQDYLRGLGLDALVKEFHIQANHHPEYPNLVLLKYNQIESPMGQPIVQECRGLILDSLDNWKVVSHPFDKFFNAGEGHADDLGSDFVVQEKLDGSLMCLYHYDGKWHVQTSGSPDAGGQVHAEKGMTFKDLFWQVFVAQGHSTDSLCPDYNYMFELTSQYNRIVVWHTTSRLTLIGARNRVTQIEAPVGCWAGKFPIVKEFPLSTMEDVIQTFATMKPMSQEGYVLRGKMKDNGSYARQKVKHPGYVAIHHMRDRLSTKAMLEVIRTGEASELLTYFPEVTNDFNKVKNALEGLVEELERDYLRIKDIPVQKDFAQEALKTRCSAAMFRRRNGQSSIRGYISTMNIKPLMDILKLKDEENKTNE